MHYKNGEAAKIGDRVLFPDSAYDGLGDQVRHFIREGLLIQAMPGSTTCNGIVAYPRAVDVSMQAGVEQPTQIVTLTTAHITIGECEKAPG